MFEFLTAGSKVLMAVSICIFTTNYFKYNCKSSVLWKSRRVSRVS